MIRPYGIARVPVAESYTPVSHAASVAIDGEAYALLTKPDQLEVIRLNFEQELHLVLPAPGDIKLDWKQNDRNSDLVAVAARRSTQSMTSTAQGYVNNSVYLNNTNLNGTCLGRRKPRYPGSAGYYGSVAYDWGGFDSVSAYNSYMQSGKQVGDIDYSAEETCSRGVDCSGFVSQCWRLSSKYGTWTLPNISNWVPTVAQIRTGDIFNKNGVHVVMVNYVANGAIMGWESTTTNSYDRVVYRLIPWSDIPNYIGYRYKSVF